MNEPNPLYAEVTRLREELLQCRSKLALAAESAAGDGELIADLLAALSNLALESRHYHNTGGGGTHLTDSIDRANAAIATAAA